ncbi:alpha/beta fold hydrolase, partial [Saccharothrix longispora]|uniref:alpha/beta fold hydrolase n=1 Tax=Saccharothrix longispora TaxID=33920 RepID=UPI0028FD12FC
RTPTSTATPAPAPTGAPRPTPSDGDVMRRDKALSRAGHNPLRVPAGDVEFDFTTDSWTELDTPHVRAHSARLAIAAQAVTAAVDLASGAFGVTTPLPHRCVVPTNSGRSAEALLCRAWPGRRGDVVQNALFPTWAVSQLDHGFTPVQVRNDPAAAEPFLGDLDLVELDRVLAAKRGRVSFVCVELSTNARGGHPVSLANLRGVREVADRHGVPLVLDATRGLENAAFVREHELRDPDRPLLDVLAELLAGARAVTIGMSKDYGVTSGGLVLTDDDELAATLREQVALRGVEAGLATRRLMTAALADTAGAERAVLERMSAVRVLWQAVVDAGLPVVGPAGGHAVLLDAARLPGAAGLEHPVASALAWVFRATGVRAAPHLDGDSLLRLAVPVGTTTAQAAEAGARLAALARSGTTPPALVRAADAGGTGAADAAYYPADRLPDDVREAMDEGHRPLDENFAVLTGYRPDVRRVLVRVGSGEVEAFTAGSGETLLLMHPFNIGAGFFGPQFAALADRYRVLAVHHSGVGATTEATDISVNGLADLFARTLDALGVAGPVHVAGASFGGIVAMAFALRHRARTASLTLIGSSYRVGNRAGEMNRLSLVADEDFRRLERNGVTVDRAGLQRMLLRCESMSTHTGLRYLDEFATDPGLLPHLPELDVPVLQVHGALDTVIPLKTGHLLHGTLPDVRFHEFPDAGHFPSLTAADRFNALLDGFLAERSATERSATERSATGATTAGATGAGGVR